MKRQERRRAEGDGDPSDAPWAEEERAESAQQPIASRQIWRAFASPAQDDQLLLEEEVLRHHRAHAPGATKPCGHHGQMQEREQEFLHARASVEQFLAGVQRCPIVNPARELAIRDSHDRAREREKDEHEYYKDIREARREYEKDRREAEREYWKDLREAEREHWKDVREAQREYQKDRREARRDRRW